jgi:hypothetical protein
MNFVTLLNIFVLHSSDDTYICIQSYLRLLADERTLQSVQQTSVFFILQYTVSSVVNSV